MRPSDRFAPSDIYSVRRLFSERRYASAQAPAVQDAVRLQLDYWRTLGRQQFCRLTTLDMVNHVKSVYHPCELTYNSLFLTFSSITALAAHQTRQTIASYLLCMYPNASRIALCRQVHPTTGNVHYHAYVKFPPGVYVILNASQGHNLSFDKQLFPNYLVQPVYKAENALAYIAKEDPHAVDWNHDFDLPEYQLQPLPVREEHQPVQQQRDEPEQAQRHLALTDLLNVYQLGSLEALVSTMLALYDTLGLERPTSHAASVALRLLRMRGE